MALPAGRYGVTKNQLLKIKKLPMNTIKLIEVLTESKCDNSVIAPVENGTTASQAYAVGSHAIRNGAFITWKNAKAQGETINDASDYTSGDVASELNVETDTYNNIPVAKFGNIAFLPSFADAAFFADGKTICQLGNKYKPNKVYSQATKIYDGSSYVDCRIRIDTDGYVSITDFYNNAVSGAIPNTLQARAMYFIYS